MKTFPVGRATPLLIVALSLLTAAPFAQQRPVFRSVREMVLVDVVVRERNGAVVKGLKQSDFEVVEDGKTQEILTFSYQELKANATALGATDLLAGVETKLTANSSKPSTAKPAPTPAAAATPATPAAPAEPDPLAFTSDELAGRRLMILLFDTSSMQPEDVQRSIDSAKKYVETKMSPADLIAVATVSTSLNVLTDFTGDRDKVNEVLNKLSYTEGTATPPPDATTMATDEQTATDDTTAETNELDMFNNDVRLRALKTLAETLQSISQKKAIVYFSAGMQRSGSDNQVELRAAINAAVRSNVSIYTVDTRGLQAVVPGGAAAGGGGGGRGGGGGGGGRGGGGGGRGLFSGASVFQQFSSLASSQDSLSTLASNTGGAAFTDSNDFSAAFTRIERDMSAYYILGYSSVNNARDGRFRRIQVRLKKPMDNVRVEARAGYFAERDFKHTAKGDRDTQLQAELEAAVSSTDLPVFAAADYFRLAPDRYFVPISLAVPGSAVPVPEGKDKVQIDVIGEIFSEMGMPIARFKQTLTIPSGGAKTLAGKQVLYQSGVVLPPGRFGMKVVVRENETGLTGSYEAPVRVPQLMQQPLKVSSVVLSTQLQQAPSGKSENPLIHGGIQLLPNMTRVVARDQKLFFYYEVYEPSTADGRAPELRTSLAFYRGKVKVMETPVVTRSVLDAPDRKAALFQFEVDAKDFQPGLYTCQVNIIDGVAGAFSFPRFDLLIK